MKDLKSRFRCLLVLGIAALLCGCSSTAETGRVQHLEDKIADQESRLTRLHQTVSASETKQRYLSDQIEIMQNSGSVGGGTLGEAGQAEVRFGFNEYDLNPEAKKALDQLAASLAADPNAIVEIRGHTDAVGSREYNFTLGQLRAESVARYLHKQFQVPLYRMTRISYGEDALARQTSETVREGANRRVEIRVLSSRGSSDTNLP